MSAPASPAPAPAASGSWPSLLALTEEFRAQSERLQAFAESQSQNDLLEDAQKKDIDKMSRRFAALVSLASESRHRARRWGHAHVVLAATRVPCNCHSC